MMASPTLFCHGTESLQPQVSTFLDVALGYDKAPQQAASKTFSNHLQPSLQWKPPDPWTNIYKV